MLPKESASAPACLRGHQSKSIKPSTVAAAICGLERVLLSFCPWPTSEAGDFIKYPVTLPSSGCVHPPAAEKTQEGFAVNLPVLFPGA